MLTDHGMPFLSKLMVDSCRLLKLKHIRMSVYHPQTNGFVEWLKQTLKQMLHMLVDEEGWNWDHMSSLLFIKPSRHSLASPHSSTCSDYDVAREAWEKQHSRSNP